MDSFYFSFGGSYQFKENWSASIESHYKFGRGIGTTIFPFLKDDLMETSGALKYVSDGNAVTGGFSQYSFIGRDFQNDISFYVKVRPEIYGNYNFSFGKHSDVGFQLQKGWYEAQMPNARSEGFNWIRYRIPGIEANIIVDYQGKYTYFREVDPDYNSFKKGMEQRIGLSYLNDFSDGKLEVIWHGGWVHEQEFTNVAEIISSGRPPPPEVIPKNIYVYGETRINFRKAIGDRFQFESNFSFYRDSNSYTTLLGKLYLKMVF